MIDAPRRLVGEDGSPGPLWHYTRADGGRMWPIGYCSPVRPCAEYPDCADDQPPCDCGGVGLVKTLDVCAGHPTPEAAYAHYRLWCFDTARYDGRRGERAQCAAPDCHVKTGGYAKVGNDEFPLCRRHLNRATLAAILGVAGEPEDHGVEEMAEEEPVDG